MEENSNSYNFDFAWTPSQEELEKVQKLAEALRELYDVFVEWAREVNERIREIADKLARFFLIQQLLEWRVPYPVADFISKKTPLYWAWRLGFRWFNNRLLALE